MRSARLFAAPVIAAVVGVGLNFLSPKIQLLNHTSKRMPEVEMTRASPPHSISHKKPVSNFTNVFVTSQKSEARNRIRIRNSLKSESDDLGHRVLKSRFVPSDSALSDCVRAVPIKRFFPFPYFFSRKTGKAGKTGIISIVFIRN